MASNKDRSESGDDASNDRSYRGDGADAGEVGVTSDDQPDLLVPSSANERDHESRSDRNGPSDTGTGGNKRPS